ncbi:MAG: RNA polymerase sigma factor [Candidatus Aminicenantes bacterium]|nr:RNA polymerase sigma factor [Candidatus Aminicenantes bacterium]
MEETAQIRLAQAGDAAAWKGLFDAHYRKVFSLAYRFLGNRSDAEDVLQDTFVKAFRGLDGFDPSFAGGFAAWIGRIGANCSLDALRRKKPRETLSLEDNAVSDPSDGTFRTDPERETGNREIRARIEEALGGLTPKQRQIFTLRHYEGYTTREIAGMIELTEGSVKTHLFRAVGSLRKRLNRVLVEDRNEM